MTRNSIQDIAKVLTERYGLEPKEAERFVNAMFDTVREGVERESLVKIKGLGTFKIIGVEARESVNVNTGERVVIESHGKVTFTPDSIMKELVNKPFSQFETVILNDGIEFDDIDERQKEEYIEEPEQSIGEESALSGNEDAAVEPDSVEPVDEKEPVENDTPTSTSFTPDDAVDEYVDKIDVTSDAVIANEEIVSEEEDSVPESIVADEITVSSDDENTSGEVDTVDEETVVDDDDDHGKKGGVWKLVLYCFATLFLMGVSAYVGYGYGRYMSKEDSRAEVRQKKMDEERQVAVKRREAQKADSMKVKSDTAVVKPQKDSVAVEKKVKGHEAFDSSKYEKMDNRVRTGAYRIVGTDKVVTVKAGETLDRLSRRILGEGMSCYIEVYNGLAEDAVLKEGQKLMIPKLELKKRVKK